ncbi:MAG: cation diffusion facilitator family transporter [Cellulosilyticaceae bacterium]
MTNFLIKCFIKNPNDTTNATVRNQYGFLGGLVGIVCNVFLFIAKLTVGFLASSVSIIADAINNLSDAGSSIITLVGFKLSGKPADEDHPFGHARIEYISALIIAFLILFLGLQLIGSSFDKILHPQAITTNFATFFILALSILIKLWMSFFNRRLGHTINSSSLKATAADSLNDVFTTSGVLIAIAISHFTGLNLDGYIGIVVALFILYSGYNIIKDTVSPLLGEAPSEELVASIEEKVHSYANVLGTHDLVVHNYGPNRCFASVHVEVDANEDIMVSHDLIDNIERDFMLDLGIHLVIHLDPIITNDMITLELKRTVETIVTSIDSSLSIHDFRAVQGVTHTNLIFDVTVPASFELSGKALAVEIDTLIHTQYPNFHSVITIDKSYLSTRINTPT